MRLIVLVPSDEYRTYAGARIRYGRLASELQKAGIQIDLEEIGSFSVDRDDYEALLISKCHDAQALVIAATASRRGKLVGLDLFDDYFSQVADSRLVRFRRWLMQLVPSLSYAVCSTPLIARILLGLRADLPVRVVNDPAPDFDVGALKAALDAKLSAARDTQTIRLAWFGIGDDPHFKVGLSDLAAYADWVRSLSHQGWTLELTVATNARALNTDALARLNGLPIRTTMEEWSEDGERALLARSFACFLPVNAQNFSAAKSLNRAVTSLSAGCQVLSAGYPLYDFLRDYIYRDPALLLQDLANGVMRHSPAGVNEFLHAISSIASAETEARGFADFLRNIQVSPTEECGRLVLIHGQATSGAAHKLIQAAGGLSIASPYCGTPLRFDVTFRGSAGAIEMLVTEKASKLLSPDLRERLQPQRRTSERKLFVLRGVEELEAQGPPEDGIRESIASELIAYGHTIRHIQQRMSEAFGQCQFLVSESSTLPLSCKI